MPCTITGSLEGDRALSLEMSNKELGRELTNLTQLLCIADKVIGNLRVSDSDRNRLERHFMEHRKIDQPRVTGRPGARGRKSVGKQGVWRLKK